MKKVKKILKGQARVWKVENKTSKEAVQRGSLFVFRNAHNKVATFGFQAYLCTFENIDLACMINGKKIVVVMPAYNASQTLEKTYREIPFEIVDEVILVDDHSKDDTFEVAKKLGIHHVIRHEKNKGYGGNQKTCYAKALEIGADVVVMLHPDYQYTPLILEAMIYPIARGVHDVMLGSRILGKGALVGGMPMYKYIANRFLTFFQNVMMGQKLAEYHTGYRAFSREVLEALPLEENSDDFVFDNEMLGQIAYAGFMIGEVTCPTKYFKEASSINFKRSMKYGFGVLRVSLTYRLHRWGVGKYKIYKKLKHNSHQKSNDLFFN